MKDRKPSKVEDERWVYAISKNRKNYLESTDNCGKWMIFAHKGEQLDKIWENVKKATERGLLGNSSKCSTMKENPNATSKDSGVICIYTYNSNDKEDLKRIAEELFKIKDVEKLFYKEDNSTYGGKYAIKGDKKISKWIVTKENFKEILI